MKTTRLLNAIKKAGLEVERLSKFSMVKGYMEISNEYHVKGKNRYGSFFDQNGNVVCLSTCRNGEKWDIMTDYFPASFHDTIKEFIHYITKE